jgi:hypothetical protein
MSKKKKEVVTPKGVVQYKYYTYCRNNHLFYYECGVVIDPIPSTCPKEGCSADVLDSGKVTCNIG